MKCRSGFVSNSSSSSFIAVVTFDQKVRNAIGNKLNIPEGANLWEYVDYYDKKKEQPLDDIGYGRYQIKGTELILFDNHDGWFDMVGIDIQKMLAVDDKKLSQCYRELKKQIAAYCSELKGVRDIKCSFEYGEWSSE